MKIASSPLLESRCRDDHGTQGALHIAAAPAVDASINQTAFKGTICPQLGILNSHCIDMTVHEDGRPLCFAVDAADHTTMGVDRDFIKTKFLHGLLDIGGYVALGS
ncbi:hypothetical protein SDC9_59491 [bioreactor metagenome]|uniref:Uncharacterized protein n=1 Tax=bioreactor metagenome TaxID=1076179 RepID=A0A644XA94_9ZZZZ